MIDVRPAGERFAARLEWLDSRHCFSFGTHYDAANTHFGLLIASNDDTVAPGAGFATHPHRGLEVLTWVLAGELRHVDSAGNRGVARPGVIGWLSAGAGVEHAETNAAADAPVRFVQMWVQAPDEARPPAYAQADVRASLDRGGVVPVAGGGGVLPLRQPDAALHVARLRPGERASLPAAPYLHVYLARGSAEIGGAGQRVSGDAVRLTDEAAIDLRGGPAGAELLVWEMHRALG